MGALSTVTFTFTGDGTTTAYNPTIWIRSSSDIKVYKDNVLVASSEYTISGITDTQFTITFNTAPANNALILIYRDAQLVEPTDVSLGVGFTESTYSSNEKKNYIIRYDNDYKFTNLGIKYKSDLLTQSSTTPTVAMMELPFPTNPGTGESNYVIAWTGTKFVWEENNQDAELEAKLTDTATASDTGFINLMTAWDATRSSAVHVGEIIVQAYGVPTSTNNYGAGIIQYWNGTTNASIQSGLDYLPLYQVGAHIPGYLFTNPRAGTWHTISPTQSIAKTTGTFTGTTYQALYLKLATEYLDKTSTQANTDWDNDVAITPSSMTAVGGEDHSIPGINTYRIA